MRKWVPVTFCLVASLPTYGKTASRNSKAQPKNPGAILAAAMPYYDFANPSMKPWHFAANYQLYDDEGKPAEKGTFEYWWLSPDVYRTTWTRTDATRTEWHTAVGKHLFAATGGELGYFEYALPSVFLSPLPNLNDLISAGSRLGSKTITLSKRKVPCVLDLGSKQRPEGIFSEPFFVPTYCFEPDKPVLILSASSNVIAVFNDILAIEGRYMARNIIFSFGGRAIFSATVKDVTTVFSGDAALEPADTANPVPDELMDSWNPSHRKLGGTLVKSVSPVYPQSAKAMGHRRRSSSGPYRHRREDSRRAGRRGCFAALNASALAAVSQWLYKPQVVDGKPAEVEILIRIAYMLGP
jgi:hypothetical protein